MTQQQCSSCRRIQDISQFSLHVNGTRFKTCKTCRSYVPLDLQERNCGYCRKLFKPKRRGHRYCSAICQARASRRQEVDKDKWKCDEYCPYWDGCIAYRMPYNLPLPCFEKPSEKAIWNLAHAPQEIVEVLNEKVS